MCVLSFRIGDKDNSNLYNYARLAEKIFFIHIKTVYKDSYRSAGMISSGSSDLNGSNFQIAYTLFFSLNLIPMRSSLCAD